MPVTFDEEVTASIWWWRKSGREVMVVEEVSLEDIDRARAEVEVDVAEVEGGSGIRADLLCSGSDFGFCY